MPWFIEYYFKRVHNSVWIDFCDLSRTAANIFSFIHSMFLRTWYMYIVDSIRSVTVSGISSIFFLLEESRLLWNKEEYWRYYWHGHRPDSIGDIDEILGKRVLTYWEIWGINGNWRLEQNKWLFSNHRKLYIFGKKKISSFRKCIKPYSHFWCVIAAVQMITPHFPVR